IIYYSKEEKYLIKFMAVYVYKLEKLRLKKEHVLEKVRSFLAKEGYEISNVMKIQYGLQISLSKNGEKIGILRIYESKRRGTSIDLSQIHRESERKSLFLTLSEMFSIDRKKEGKIVLPQKFYLRSEKLRDSVKNEILKYFSEKVSEILPKPHQDYVLKINGVTITQFKSGVLLIQGKPSELSDKVYALINETCRRDSSEEFIGILSENLSKLDFKRFKKESGKYKVNIKEYISQDLFDYLYPNDQVDLRDGIILLEWAKKYNIPFKNFAILVRNFAIVYEGFLIKVFIDLGIISQEDFETDARKIKIGSILKDFKERKRNIIPCEKFERKYPYLPDKMFSLWMECRNKILHSDYVSPHQINSIEKAESKIREILDIMEKVFEVSSINDETSGIIGTDESGKGDFFGPLVIAGVYADSEKTLQKLSELGVRDSKKLSDNQILKLAKEIRKICKYDIVVISPLRYNELYDKMNNLNKLLAWGHARVIENLLSVTNCEYVVSDQFGDEFFIKEALMERGKGVILEQRPKAEENIVVAAASIIARDKFLQELKKLSRRYSIRFPKGSSKNVIHVAKKFISLYGVERLKEVAKVHFRTMEELITFSEFTRA
ncbi:MAG: ribonuclease HIII, partial [Candidatus Korarchaeota archaeon]|nr:ribonuclease HIII [Candidatus Korarchaeota archaeon]